MPGGNEDMNLEEEVLVNHEDTSNVDVQNDNDTQEPKEEEKTYTQDEIDKLISKTRKKTS